MSIPIRSRSAAVGTARVKKMKARDDLLEVSHVPCPQTHIYTYIHTWIVTYIKHMYVSMHIHTHATHPNPY
ncbi:hypothetical protein EON63_02070 [archaeon]|nr:MAG: hypothetical protein EON63_02070 [archaeon]